MTLQIKIRAISKDAKLPTKAHDTDACWDIYAAGCRVLGRGHKDSIPTGIAVEIPPGYAMHLWDRSGLAAKHGLHILGGVIDCDYRGEIKVIMVNLGREDYAIFEGHRIAQAQIVPVLDVNMTWVDKLSDTGRGVGGFGNSGY